MKSTSLSTFIFYMGIPYFCAYTDLNRIVGGGVVKIEDYPYMVSFRKYNQTTCGGSIINSNTVLTAAHCLKMFWRNPEAYHVAVGETLSNGMENGQFFDIDEAIQHPNYDHDNDYKNDIAILKIIGEFSYNEKVQPIELWTDALPIGELVTISGWGLTDENTSKVTAQPLKAAEVPILTNEDCQEAYNEQNVVIRDLVFCAGFVKGGVDTCQGDSGGPVVFENRQIGIVSFGIGCATAQYPGVYTNIGKYRDWIEENFNTYR